MLTIFVVSDATGETAERVLRSALVQFAEAPATILRRGGVLSEQQVRQVVREAARQPSLLLHTLVSDELRRVMLEESRLQGVDSLDLLGPVLERLATHLKLTPQERPGLFKQITEARTREIEAVEFAFRHDDGQRPDELEWAEVVLVGVSRTMKTPTTLFLAYRGWFAANVPIIEEVALPPTLARVPSERVFCLMMAPARLLELRRARAEHLGVPLEPYTSPESVRRELHHARKEALQHGWRIVEVTGKSVEEVAREILLLLPWRDPGHPPEIPA
jgi:[pyruvate, water dikinase]-phosphate phosphotransferase / [pyruvate, water dikinase] kinase